jgi:NAD(P)-dependent dehydrogenase (short-subunit alcohol dehydrogenase family)
MPAAPPGAFAVVTGAGGTVGSAITEALAGAGLEVVLVGRSPAKLAATAERLARRGAVTGVVACDLAERGEVDELANALRRRPGWPGVLVNAAGRHGPLEPLAGTDPDQWAAIAEVNLLAPMRLAARLLPAMSSRGWGRIVQVSSAAALGGAGPYNSAYSVSKAALNRLTAHLAAETAGTGVTVHALHPGEVVSGMWREIAERAAADPRLEDFATWAESARIAGDSPEVAGRMVLDLLDDATAERLHGCFLWPPDRGLDPVRL